MKISAEKKKEQLLDSFDLLKTDYGENSSSLSDIVEKMAKIDLDTAVSMWKYLIKENPDVLHTDDDFGFWFMYALEKKIGIEKVAEIVSNDNFLKESIYKNCGDISSTPLDVVSLYVSQGKLGLANELMDLIFSNKNKVNSLYEILDNIIPDKDEKITEDTFDLLNRWIEKVPRKTERAKLNLKMLDFMDEDDE